MTLHRKIGTANMDKLLYEMWNNGVGSGRVHQLIVREPWNERSLTLKLNMVLKKRAESAS
ncbi:hypothetical protein T03_17214 [Trichinella britovi]|uniref:Uncharacterized protein n=1 Tax=Trichinella britovi TaxID=45882 RepID=A0A0V1CVF3_TRIBR|nr:hypothetical protein T03_17214 [Trichinella britovi]